MDVPLIFQHRYLKYFGYYEIIKFFINNILHQVKKGSFVSVENGLVDNEEVWRKMFLPVHFRYLIVSVRDMNSGFFYSDEQAFLDRQLQPLAEKIIRLFVLHGALLRPIGQIKV